MINSLETMLEIDCIYPADALIVHWSSDEQPELRVA